ncbi:MAG: hypothetical protein KDC98_22940 [Planctomycetes bacterium]|nr:hypothetical protein [Planctomycetota bacterium]
MKNLRALPLFATCIPLLTTPAAAQEKYWVAGSTGATQIDTSGFVHQAVPPSGGRDFAVAPDGKVWIPNGAITVLNSDGTLFTTITAAVSAYSIAFDRAGHAWVAGSSGNVEEFDAAGTSLGVTLLPTGQPRCICVDADGNKWIAHRIGPPGALSRIDAVTGTVTTHSLPTTSLILPIGVYADCRGFGNSSHIWTVGDNRGAGELVEFDAAGNYIGTVVISTSARLQWLSGDCNASGLTTAIWVGDWSNGDLHRVDVATGGVTTYPQTNGVGGVTFDGFGDLWVTMRGTGHVRRIDEATGGVEIDAAAGATTQISTRWQYATVVDPLGDLDLDNTPNIFEVMAGSSPFDACSTPAASFSIGGTTGIGSTMSFDCLAAPGDLTLMAFSFGLSATPLTVPGIACAVDLDPTLITGTLALIGPAGVSLSIPNFAGLIGQQMFSQGLNVNGATFTNVAPVMFF